ncbi:unnamed protein product [Linum tenue]|uniref:F-box domain-containing protein n=1 Tax=Linum tenue TaxID=586396 RepID=A0AAV0IHU0_9ROSI|nr:unnamed protein product [Linum tenue]
MSSLASSILPPKLVGGGGYNHCIFSSSGRCYLLRSGMATETCNSDYEPLSKQRRTRSPLISKLGDDLLLEVLIRLPNPRYACRSKSVCKLWRSLISDPGFNRRFVSLHQSISEQQPPLLLPSDDPQSIIGSFVPTPPGLRLVALDSCGDLILCGFPLREEHITTICRMYIICNPFTKQWMPLPLEPLWPDGTSELAARLVCEPSISSNLDLGDGQVHVYSEYRFRVVCLYNHGKALKLDVFCSEYGEWTKEALVGLGDQPSDAEMPNCAETLLYTQSSTGA